MLWLVAVTPLRAQTPPRTAALTGIVRDTAGLPVAFVEILLEGTTLATRTGADGRFRLDRIAPGHYVMRIRRVGFDPADMPFTARGGEETRIEVRLVALALRLEAVTAVARVQSISGWVADSARMPLVDAIVELAGTRRDTLVGEDGRFHFGDLEPGSYLVVVRRLGYAPWRRGITLRDGDRVDLSALLAPIAQSWIVGDEALSGTNARAQMALMDMRRRRARGGARVVYVTREELAALGKQPLDRALARVPSVIAKGYSSRELERFRVVYDGQPLPLEGALVFFSADAIEMAEIHPADACHSRQRQTVPGATGAFMDGCAAGTVFVWSR